MQYLSGYFWRQEEKVSLVLKHLVYPNGEEPVLFGCLARGEGAAQFVKKITDWFYREGLDFCKGLSVTPEILHEKLQTQLKNISKGNVEGTLQGEGRTKHQKEVQRRMLENCEDAESSSAKENTISAGAVLICAGEYFALWSSPGQQVFLHNTRFGRPNVRLLTDGKQEQFLCGKLQKGVGILVPAFKVGQQIGKAELAECLAVKTLTDEKRLEKRLREIGEEAARRGAEQVSSLLVVTC